MRKVQLLHFENYNQGLKNSYRNCFSVQTDCTYINSFPKTFKKSDLALKTWAKLDELTLGQVNIESFLASGARVMASASITFEVSYTVQGGTWATTSVFTGAGTEFSPGRFKLNVPTSLFPTAIGNYTINVTATASRRGSLYTSTDRFNHIGIFILSAYNKTKISFLEATKADA